MAIPLPVDSSTHEDEAWAWLETHFTQHRRQLYLFALGRLGNREDAEDAAQTVLLNAYRALGRGERPTWPRAWLFAIALNVCRRLRGERARRFLPAGTLELVAPQPASDSFTGAEISQAVSSLPQGQREIFVLREFRGLSYTELSETLGLSAAAAESRLARARRTLREQLTASGENRRPLLGIPGAGFVSRLARAPATFKLVALAGTAAIAPVLAVGIHALPERSPHPGLKAAVPVVQPAQRAFTRSAGHRSSSRGSTAGTTRGRAPQRPAVAVRSPRPLPTSSASATVASATATPASPGAGTAEVVTSQASPTGDTSPGVTAGDRTKPGQTTHTLPGTDTVDTAVTAAQAATDDLVAAVPVPDVPTDVIPAVPDPPPVVQDAQDTVSSTVPGVLPKVP